MKNKINTEENIQEKTYQNLINKHHIGILMQDKDLFDILSTLEIFNTTDDVKNSIQITFTNVLKKRNYNFFQNYLHKQIYDFIIFDDDTIIEEIAKYKDLTIPYVFISSTKNIIYGSNSHNKMYKFSLPLNINTLLRFIIESIRGIYKLHDNISFNYNKRLLQKQIISTESININLTEKESDILLYFILGGTANTKNKNLMFKQIWGYKIQVDIQTINNHLFRLKSKLKTLNIRDIQELINN